MQCDFFSFSMFRPTQFLPRLYLPLLSLLCLAYCWRPLSGADDVWAHAAVGRWIAQHGSVPHETLFLWGSAPIRWVYHSWLSQLTFYALMARGPLLILLLTSALVILTFALLWSRTLRTNGSTHAPLWMPPVFALAIFCSSLRFHPRPELFTALFLVVLLLMLGKEEKIQTSLAFTFLAAVLLFGIWANFHGAVAIGVALAWCAALGDAIQDIIQSKAFSGRALRSLKIALAAALAIWITPFGWEYWQALRPVGGVMFTRIDEWKPFWRSPVLDFSFVAGEAVLVSIAFFAWLGNARRRWAELAWLLLMTAMFVLARRHLWLLPIVCLAVIATNARTLSTLTLWRAFASAENVSTLRFASRLAMIAVLICGVIFVAPPPSRWSRLVATDLPLDAARVVKSRYANARIFNDYENSSYLQWSFAGKPPLYIDLLNAYPDDLILNYFDIVNARKRGKKLLDTDHIEAVILRKYDSKSPLAKLGAYLDQRRLLWRRVYSGQDGTVWVRRDSAAKS
jgi:hypothetical protein